MGTLRNGIVAFLAAAFAGGLATPQAFGKCDGGAGKDAPVIFSGVVEQPLTIKGKQASRVRTLNVYKGAIKPVYTVVSLPGEDLPHLSQGSTALFHARQDAKFPGMFVLLGCGATRYLDKAKDAVKGRKVLWSSEPPVDQVLAGFAKKPEDQRLATVESIGLRIRTSQGREVEKRFFALLETEPSERVRRAMIHALLDPYYCEDVRKPLLEWIVACSEDACEVLADPKEIARSRCYDELFLDLINGFARRPEQERRSLLKALGRLTDLRFDAQLRREFFPVMKDEPNEGIKIAMVRMFIRSAAPADDKVSYIGSGLGIEEQAPAVRKAAVEAFAEAAAKEAGTGRELKAEMCRLWRIEPEPKLKREMAARIAGRSGAEAARLCGETEAATGYVPPTSIRIAKKHSAFEKWNDCLSATQPKSASEEAELFRECRRQLPPFAKDDALTDEEVHVSVLRRAHVLRPCYEALLERKPAAAGTLFFKGVINGKGAVADVGISRDGFGDEFFLNCAVSAFRRILFPEPRGGGAFAFEDAVQFAPPRN